jgi:formylglycine-generating enzyme required for sulfatase activity
LESEKWPPNPPSTLEIPEGMIWIPTGSYITTEEHFIEDFDEYDYDYDPEIPYFIPATIEIITPLDHDFLISQTPVTNSQYARFIAETGHPPPFHWIGGDFPKHLENHPVVYVDLYDAMAYAKWAGGILLSEQEWEKAARGIDGRNYPWGNEFIPTYCNTKEGNVGTTVPVDQYSPRGNSKCGCVDMSGNVWEWTMSASHGEYVLRGGSFICDRTFAHLSHRLVVPPFFKNWSSGFRIGKYL